MERYALIEEQAPDLHHYLAILNRRKWQVIGPIALLLPIVVVVAMILSPVYRSTATILIEQQEIPTDLIRTTVTSFADQRIRVIEQRVMTLRNLGDLIEKYDLYPRIRENVSLNAAVAAMRKDTSLNMVSAQVVDPRSGRAQQATIAFSLSFDHSSPNVAQNVTNALVSLFMEENLRQRETAVEETSAFLREEAERLAERIRELEAARAEFKEQHRNNLPAQSEVNRELMQRAEEQLRNNNQAIRSSEDQLLVLEMQLGQIDPQLVGGQPSPELRLRQLEAAYPGIAARYQSTHPDRVTMEREIEALRKVVASSDLSALRDRQVEVAQALQTARERYSREHPDVRRLERDLALANRRLAAAGPSEPGAAIASSAQNPAYFQLVARLEGVKLELRSLRESRQEIQARIKTYEQRLVEAPQIEREYNELTRGYENAVAKYREVKDKQLEAELAESMEADRKAERFTLIEPPSLPTEPVKPNRPAIMTLGVIGAAAAGAGHLAMREFLDRALYSARAVQLITGAPPLALIPHITVAADRRRRIWLRVLLSVTAAVLLVGAVVTVHFFVRPLDIFWFTLLRKLELHLLTASLPPGMWA